MVDIISYLINLKISKLFPNEKNNYYHMGSPYSLYPLEGLLENLSKKYEINIILMSIYNAESVLRFFNKNTQLYKKNENITCYKKRQLKYKIK